MDQIYFFKSSQPRSQRALSLASKKKSENPGNEVEVFKEGAMKYVSQQFHRSDGQLLVKAFNIKIKLRNVIRRVVVSNITIKNENRYVFGLKNCRNSFECLVYEMLIIRHLHASHNALLHLNWAPQIFNNLSFSFLLGITAVPREIENNAYAKIWGANKMHYGRCASGGNSNQQTRFARSFSIRTSVK